MLTVLGFLAVLAGQYLPWLHLNLTAIGNSAGGDVVSNASRTSDLAFSGVYTLPALTYGLSVLAVLAGAATLLTVTSPALRRSFAAATLGLLAGQLAVLVGLGAGLARGSRLQPPGRPVQPARRRDHARTGLPGVVRRRGLLVAAVIVGGRTARSRRTTERTKRRDEPIDLVVTPLPSETVDIRSERP